MIKSFSEGIKFSVAFLLALCLALSAPQLTHSLSSGPEIRGVWLTNIDSDVLFSRQKTEEAIATLADLNFNTLYPTVWNWGYTLYPSQVAKETTGREIDPAAGLRNRDVLKEIVAQARRHDMAVIPWFEFGFMAPADSELARLHPDWLTQRLDGTNVWLEGNVHERVWLNPLHPEVQKFIRDLVVEIVANYDIDGIQFDDHFGYPSELGYDPQTIQLYRQEHQGNFPPSNPDDGEWIQWRADKITNYMEDLFKAIKAVKSNVLVSLSPNPQTFSLEKFLLDWEKWERKGLVEELILQLYRDNMEAFNRELSQPEIQAAKQHIPTGIGILSGLKGRPVNFDLIEQQVSTARQNDFAGVSFFFYESLWNFGPETKEGRILRWKKMFPWNDKRI